MKKVNFLRLQNSYEEMSPTSFLLRQDWLNSMFLLLLFCGGCSSPDIRESKKEVLKFEFPNLTYNKTTTPQGYHFEFPIGTDLSSLTPHIIVTSTASIYPPSKLAQNFIQPITYTVSAEDRTTHRFTVSTSAKLSDENQLLFIKLVSIDKQTIEQEGNNVIIYIPYETDLNIVSAELTVSDHAIVSREFGPGTLEESQPMKFEITSSTGISTPYTLTIERSKWHCIYANGEAPFTRVDGHKLIVFRDKLWLLGGWVGNYDMSQATYIDAKGGGFTSQVWSTDDGEKWNFEGNAPWNGRHGFGCVIFNDRLCILGGDEQLDMWSSADGKNWQKEVDVLPFGKRYFMNAAAFKDHIFINGGDNVGIGNTYTKYDDTWHTLDGVNWGKTYYSPLFAPRGLVNGTVILNDEWYIIGGSLASSEVVFNDVWKSKDGIIWSSVTSNAEWSPKRWSSVATFDNKMWIVGGDKPPYTQMYSNEVWYSENGRNWQQQKGVFWEPRHACALAEFKGRLWMVGGARMIGSVADVSNELWVMEK